MIATARSTSRGHARAIDQTDRVSFARLAWVAPLTVAATLAVNLLIKYLAQALDPSLANVGRLGTPLISLTLQGAIAAVVVFAIVAYFVPRPIFWYRILATVAVLLSLVPDIALGIGGPVALWGIRLMGPFLSVGGPSGPAPSASGPAAGGPPAGGIPAAPIDQVVVLMLLHVAAYAVCVVLLTTLARQRSSVTATAE